MAPKAAPFHPPYALMISAAITSLGGARGSTAPSISGYIKANFAGLPRGHERLLPYYLHKLTAQGEFVRGPGGRYVVGGDGAGPGPAADRGDDEGVPIACDGDLVVEVRPIATVLRGRGRPPKRRRRGPDGGVGPALAVVTTEADSDGLEAASAGAERPGAPSTQAR